MGPKYYVSKCEHGYWENPITVQRNRQRAWLNAIAKPRHRKGK